MHYYLFIVFYFISISNIQGQKDGIDFYNKKWKSVLTKAKEENKLIFINSYKNRCNSCDWMDDNIYNDKSVGDFYNEHFVNVSIEMNSPLGKKIAKTYNLHTYPTLLFVDANEAMVHVHFKSCNRQDFLTLGQAAMDPKRQLGNLKNKYDKGEKDPQFLMTFALALKHSHSKQAPIIAQEYLKSIEVWGDKEMHFIFEMADWPKYDSYLVQLAIANKELYNKLKGEEIVTRYLKYSLFYQAMNSNETTEEVERIYKSVFPNKYKQYSEEFKLWRSYDKKTFMKIAKEYFAKYGTTDAELLNYAAKNTYKRSDNIEALKIAKKWVKKSILLNPNYHNNSTLAAICFKLGEKDEALKSVVTAIKTGESNGFDINSNLELLEKIKAL